MAGFGPPPKPASQRRHRSKTLADAKVTLPPEGRQGPPPRWPLGRAAAAQSRLWRELWATPQAAAWEHLGWPRVVARYVLLLLEAEKAGASPALLAEVRQMEDRLGLSPMALLRLRWEIGQAQDRPAGVPSLDDYRAALG